MDQVTRLFFYILYDQLIVNRSVVLGVWTFSDNNYFLLDSVDSWESKLDCWTQTAKVLDHMTEAAAYKFPGNYLLICYSDGIKTG